MTHLRLFWFTVLADLCSLLGVRDRWGLRRRAGAIRGGLARRGRKRESQENVTC